MDRRPASLVALRRRLSWTARSTLATRRTYLRFARWKYPLNAVRGDTEIVIDGFMRTASTFAVVAFQMSQPRPVRVAHHVHAPAQIIEGVRMGIPVVVTVRAPEESVLSTAVWEPHVGVERALRAYVRFYTTLLPWRERVVVAEYARVTSDFGSVVAEVNDRFGTGFAVFTPSEQALAECFALIDDRSRRPAWDWVIGDFLSGFTSRETLDAVRGRERPAEPAEPTPATRVARPSARREAEKDRLRGAYHSARLAPVRRSAEAAYAAFAAGAVRDPAPAP